MNYLHEGLIQLGFEKGDFFGIKTLPLLELEQKMDSYIKILQEYNAKFDLINTDNYDEIAVRHILDSLSGASKVAELCAALIQNSGVDLALGVQSLLLADIGSGAVKCRADQTVYAGCSIFCHILFGEVSGCDDGAVGIGCLDLFYCFCQGIRLHLEELDGIHAD